MLPVLPMLPGTPFPFTFSFPFDVPVPFVIGIPPIIDIGVVKVVVLVGLLLAPLALIVGLPDACPPSPCAYP